ncbi:MAG TPA: metallophosphoesterase [Geobacterales bacterium]|nr:metallophosphoesterase [Geobacterales bacterium]
MEISGDIKFFKDCYSIYIKSLASIVMSDLHLGYEGVAAKNGIFLPKLNLKYIFEQIESIANNVGKSKIRRIIVVGDVKNEFDDVDDSEIDELFSFVNYLRNELFDKDLEIILIKGNHDNYVDAYAKELKLTLYRQEAMLAKYLFFHGEEMPTRELLNKANFLITAHEHPAITVFTEIGTRMKVKCFLYGIHEKKEVLVLPALCYYASGTEINLIPKEELLSPFLKSIDVDELIPISVEGDILVFPKIKDLRI